MTERFEELKRSASMAKVFELEVNVIDRDDIVDGVIRWFTRDDMLGGIHIPSDGYANAVDITQALAKGARANGVQIFQNTKVTEILHDGYKVTGVSTPTGDIDADYVVICGGMWSRDLAASVGVNVPLHACEHYYALFESVEGLRSGPARAARLRCLHLLQVRRRQIAGRCLRTHRQTLGHGRHCRGFLL